MWKVANVTPIHKKGEKYLVKNCRPISLLPICSKILEKIVFNQLYSHLINHNLISKNQFDDHNSLEVRSVFFTSTQSLQQCLALGVNS